MQEKRGSIYFAVVVALAVIVVAAAWALHSRGGDRRFGTNNNVSNNKNDILALEKFAQETFKIKVHKFLKKKARVCQNAKQFCLLSLIHCLY